MSNSLSNIGLSGIDAAQYGLTTTGQNISNAATPGYSRQQVLLKPSFSIYTGGGFVGTGVDVETVKRNYSDAISARLDSAQSQSSAMETYGTEAKSLNALVGDPANGIANTMSGFFASAQSLSGSPSDTALRTAMMGSAQAVVNAVHQTAEQMNVQRASVNAQITDTVSEINRAATSIAKLNHQITAESAKGQPPNSLLDERDKQFANLGKLVNVNMTTQSDGSYSIFTGTGQPLVLGSQTFALAAVRSPIDVSEMTIGYRGAVGADDTGGKSGYLNENTLTGGKLGGLLTFRSQMLDPAQSQLGRIATAFAGGVNQQNAQGVDMTGQPGKALFNLDKPTVTANEHNRSGATLDAAFGDTGKLTGDDYVLSYDGRDYTLSNVRTGTQTQVSNWPATIDGVEYKLHGPMAAGDSFKIMPTRAAGTQLTMATTEGSAIAAGQPVVTSAATGNRGTGAIALKGLDGLNGRPVPDVRLTVEAKTDPKTGASVATLSGFPKDADVTVTVPGGAGSPDQKRTFKSPAGDIPFVPGSVLDFGGMQMQVNGTPRSGDTFNVARNAAMSGDGSNIVKMGNLQNANLVNGDTLTRGYADYVGQVGSLASQNAIAHTTQETLVTQLKGQQQEVSGVNLDEEAANLMQYQQMYQANSKVISTSETLFQTILDLAR